MAKAKASAASAPAPASVGLANSGKTNDERVYVIVNPSGALHQVTYDLARALLRRAGYRQATAEEIQTLEKAHGHQVHDAPIAPRWSPEPVELGELDESE